MKKIFVLVPYMGRSDAELQKIREDAVELYRDRRQEEAELILPQGKRLSGDIEAMFEADLVVCVKYHQFDPVCCVVMQAIYTYGKEFIEDRDIVKIEPHHDDYPDDTGE